MRVFELIWKKKFCSPFQSSPVSVGFWKRDGPEMRDLDMKMCSQIYCRSDADRVSNDTENDTIWQWYFSQSSKIQFLIIFNNKNKYGRMYYIRHFFQIPQIHYAPSYMLEKPKYKCYFKPLFSNRW